jgi:bidirectional [NiFe] hydrogenase diaphorase subunit
MTVHIQVDGKPLIVEKNLTVLQACLGNDIYIPHLCFMQGMEESPASCRLCFVQIDDMAAPVTACTMPVSENMVVLTGTPEVRELQRTSLSLLLSVHDVDCKNCPANKKCELQRIARFLNVPLKTKALQHYRKESDRIDIHPCFDYLPNRCVLCGKCIHVCRAASGHQLLSYAGRGFDTVIHFSHDPDVLGMPCDRCLACVNICPVAALIPKLSDSHTV